MAQGDLAMVRQALEGFGGQSAEELIPWTTEDVELRSAVIGTAEGNMYRGHDGVREWARERDESFDEIRFISDEIREVGDLVVVLGHIHARGEASGLTLDAPSGWVVSVRDGKIATLHGYLDHGAALEAARAGTK
jgi:ketosteroid isomerase-like protein